jgi:acetyl esterase
VVLVDYRLAPEHRYPAAADDAWAVLQWAGSSIEAIAGSQVPLIAAGDSAGGNLAAAVALRARDDTSGGPAIAFQLLVYPVVDLSAGRSQHESQRTNGEGYFLTRSSMEWYRSQYLADEADGENPLASPFVAADLSGLPPAYVVTAEFDPLRDEGEAYARRLQDAGVPTTLVRVDGMFHGFFSMPRDVIPAAGAAVDGAGAALNTALAH